MPVAGDEGVPDRGWDAAGEAADVEDLAGPVGEDATDFGVAAEPFEGGGGQPSEHGGFAADGGDEVGVFVGEVVDVLDDDHVGVAAPAGGAVVVMIQGAAAHRFERFGAPFRQAAGVAGPFQRVHLGVERAGRQPAQLGVEGTVQHASPCQGGGEGHLVEGVLAGVIGGAAVAVERVDDSLDLVAYLRGMGQPGQVRELGLNGFEHRGPLGRVRGGDDLGVMAGDLPGPERGGRFRQRLELAGQHDRTMRHAGDHPALRPQRGGGAHESFGGPIAGPFERGDLAQFQELDLFGDPHHAFDITARLVGEHLLDCIVEVVNRTEHASTIRRG